MLLEGRSLRSLGVCNHQKERPDLPMFGAPAQVARGRAIIPANKRHVELEPTIIGER